MAAIVEAIGLLSGALGIIQFGIDNFPEQETVGSTIRITVGLDTKDGLNNAGGDLPDVRLFNEAGDFMGISADPGKVKTGGFGDIKVDHNGDSLQQAAYTLFSANDDAICIAVASITWPNGDKYSWVGDWGHQCGGSWYYSNVFISGTDHKPDCLWIDKNNDQPQTGFQVHWPDFSPSQGGIPDDADGKARKIDALCNAGPPFKMYEYPDSDPRGIVHWIIKDEKRSSRNGAESSPGGTTATSYGASKHGGVVSGRFSRITGNGSNYYPRGNDTAVVSPPASPQHANRLVIDSSAGHTADGLCESATSVGPDFLDLAGGLFCRMTDKTLWPVCDGLAVRDNCFNTDLQQLVANGVMTRDTPYDHVLDWTSSGSK